MTDAVVSAPAKDKKASKPKKPAAHPKYSEMISAALGALNDGSGSSRQAILKCIQANYSVGANATAVNGYLKVALKSGSAIKKAKGTGASGSFKLREKKKAPAKKVAKPKAAKPKKPKTPEKKAAAKKPTAKKAAKPKAAKKPAAKKAKTPTKTAAKPKKAAAKSPKKAKTPKKAAAKK